MTVFRPLSPPHSIDVRESLKPGFISGWVSGRIIYKDAVSVVIQSRGQQRKLEALLSENQTALSAQTFLGRAQLGDIVSVLIEQGEREIFSKGVVLNNSQGHLSYVPFDYEASRRWTKFKHFIRSYFIDQEFIEIETPTLVASPGTEPFLDPFEVEFRRGALKIPYYLPTSPEFHLKKALVRGWTKIFEMKRVFRNGEITEHHQPEFTMLEWYRAYERPNQIVNDLKYLVSRLETHFGHSTSEWVEYTMSELFEQFLQFKLTPETGRDDLLNLCAREEVDRSESDSWTDLFHRLMFEKIEPQMKDGRIWLVRDFPPSESAFARLTTEGWADRFEMYWKGLEITNCFHELNDAEENLRRQVRDLEIKAKNQKTTVALDSDFQSHMLHGLPPAAGIALGVDRLFMALFDYSEISETRLFSMSAD